MLVKVYWLTDICASWLLNIRIYHTLSGFISFTLCWLLSGHVIDSNKINVSTMDIHLILQFQFWILVCIMLSICGSLYTCYDAHLFVHNVRHQTLYMNKIILYHVDIMITVFVIVTDIVTDIVIIVIVVTFAVEQ